MIYINIKEENHEKWKRHTHKSNSKSSLKKDIVTKMTQRYFTSKVFTVDKEHDIWPICLLFYLQKGHKNEKSTDLRAIFTVLKKIVFRRWKFLLKDTVTKMTKWEYIVDKDNVNWPLW